MKAEKEGAAAAESALNAEKKLEELMAASSPGADREALEAIEAAIEEVETAKADAEKAARRAAKAKTKAEAAADKARAAGAKLPNDRDENTEALASEMGERGESKTGGKESR
jgi:hypothetical protein